MRGWSAILAGTPLALLLIAGFLYFIVPAIASFAAMQSLRNPEETLEKLDSPEEKIRFSKRWVEDQPRNSQAAWQLAKLQSANNHPDFEQSLDHAFHLFAQQDLAAIPLLAEPITAKGKPILSMMLEKAIVQGREDQIIVLVELSRQIGYKDPLSARFLETPLEHLTPQSWFSLALHFAQTGHSDRMNQILKTYQEQKPPPMGFFQLQYELAALAGHPNPRSFLAYEIAAHPGNLAAQVLRIPRNDPANWREFQNALTESGAQPVEGKMLRVSEAADGETTRQEFPDAAPLTNRIQTLEVNLKDDIDDRSLIWMACRGTSAGGVFALVEITDDLDRSQHLMISKPGWRLLPFDSDFFAGAKTLSFRLLNDARSNQLNLARESRSEETTDRNFLFGGFWTVDG